LKCYAIDCSFRVKLKVVIEMAKELKKKKQKEHKVTTTTATK